MELEGGGEQTTVGGAQLSAAVDSVVGSDPPAPTDQNVISSVVCLQGSGLGTHNALGLG